MIYSFTPVFLATALVLSAQTVRENPRPVERPSRTVEVLRERQVEAAREVEAAKSKNAAGGGGEAVEKGKAAPAVYRVTGAEVWEVARLAGWKFFPKGARGALDGVTTTAEIQPGVVYSLVQGPVMTQRRTQAGWGRISENSFYFFTDGRGRARSLAKGWTVQDIRLSGDPFQWVVRPQAGGGSPSLAIQLAGGRGPRDSVVRLESVVLQGPPEAKDWREAFTAK